MPHKHTRNISSPDRKSLQRLHSSFQGKPQYMRDLQQPENVMYYLCHQMEKKIYILKYSNLSVKTRPQVQFNDISSEKSYLKELDFLQWVGNVVFLLESVAVFEQNFNSLIVVPLCCIDHSIVVGFGGSLKILMSWQTNNQNDMFTKLSQNFMSSNIIFKSLVRLFLAIATRLRVKRPSVLTNPF